MSAKSDYSAAPETSDTGLEEQTVSTTQEATPVPYLAGERKIAVRWLALPVITHTEKIETEGKK